MKPLPLSAGAGVVVLPGRGGVADLVGSENEADRLAPIITPRAELGLTQLAGTPSVDLD